MVGEHFSFFWLVEIRVVVVVGLGLGRVVRHVGRGRVVSVHVGWWVVHHRHRHHGLHVLLVLIIVEALFGPLS